MAEKRSVADADDVNECSLSKRCKRDDDASNDEGNGVANNDASKGDNCDTSGKDDKSDEVDESNKDVTDDKNDDGVSSEPDLSTFTVEKVLQSNSARKFICLEGKLAGSLEPAVVLLEQKSLPTEEQALQKAFFDKETVYQKTFTNDIYRNYNCFPRGEYSSVRTILIHPASPSLIKKYTRQDSMYIIDETYEIYQTVTLPYILSMGLDLEWVTNILEHKAEQENIIYEDLDKETGFILITDFKWDKQLETLKLLALPFKKLKSLRELDASHLPLLRNIRDAGVAAISEKFNLPASQLRIYFHYQPSYYHLHVHFCNLTFDAPGIYAEKAHLLSTVIRNLELMPDYYTKAILSYVVRAGTALYEKLKSHDVLKIPTCKALNETTERENAIKL